MRYKVFSIVVIVAALAFVIESYVTRSSVTMRSGPGSYYEMVLRVNKDAEVTFLDEENEGWLKIRIDEFEGWVPKQALISAAEAREKQRQQNQDDPFADAFSDFDDESSEAAKPYASPAQVAAVVKGFAKKFKSKRRRDETIVDYTGEFEGRIGWRDYVRFRKSRVRDGEWKVLKTTIPLQFDELPNSMLDADMIGLGIANNIAQQGLIKNYEVQEYLNFIGLMIAESSHRYEIPVQVHITDSDNVAGFACPNGIIFVSRGALKLMRNEAEFAFFVAHELTHITMMHGLQEMEDRRVQIKAAGAFAELEDELNYDEMEDDEYVRVSNELSDFADQVYEYLVAEKLEGYERDADSLGFVYMARAGYNPAAGLSLLQRFLQNEGDYADKTEGNLNWEGLSLEERIKAARASVSVLQRLGVRDGMHSEEWREKMRTL